MGRFSISFQLMAVAIFATTAILRADVLDDNAALQGALDETALEIHGGRWTPDLWKNVEAQRAAFGETLTEEKARAIWNEPLPAGKGDAYAAAQSLGILNARLQHVAALEMLDSQQRGDIEAAKQWRSIITLPKYTNSVEGAMALQRMGGEARHSHEVARLLAREYLIWQITRAREKADALGRIVQEGYQTPELIAARAAEIQELSVLPPSLLALATDGKYAESPDNASALFQSLLAAKPDMLSKTLTDWRLSLEGKYPNLLSEEDVQRRERIILKLLRLIPREYQSGVRDGEVTIPIEYREAKNFTIQCRQIINELMPVWRQQKAEALAKSAPQLFSVLDTLEGSIRDKMPLSDVEDATKNAISILQGDFGLTLKRAGSASSVVEETALEVRSLLGSSLAAAQAGDWRKADAFRLDAYVNYDLEIESRALPRDPDLAMRAERTFLDGADGKPGIKAALDARLSGDELSAAYERAFAAIDETVALVKVGLSPYAALCGAIIIIAREGLEAVVILAAILAGLRGVENARMRHRIGIGAWLALLVSVILFVASRSILQGLTHHGETLESVISIIAVVILLMVTNWVFHKYYWTGWNAKLRGMSRSAQQRTAQRFESMALVGVGFMTIFREGFETTLFMQSLILEAGMKPVLAGIAIGGLLIAALGWAVFSIGMRLPYRKMLIFTGILVVLVLFTFLGSTTRLFQTVGWLPVHPIPGLRLPTWMGVWLGLYPTWEGILIPFSTFLYVGGMWFWVKISSRRAQAALNAKAAAPRPPEATSTSSQGASSPVLSQQ